MARVDADALEHHELERVFIAARLKEAQRVEEVLTLEGVDYVVNVEPFVSGLFGVSTTEWRSVLRLVDSGRLLSYKTC